MELQKPDIAIAQKSAFFGSMPADLLNTLIKDCSVVALAEGQPLFSQGDPAKSVYAVLDGMVKLTRSLPNGDDVIVEVFHPGESFAEALAFKKAVYPVGAVALLDCRILAVPNEAVISEISARPESFGAILGATYSHLHRLLVQIEELKSTSGHRRLARYILAKAKLDRGKTVAELPFEKKVLAALLGIKPETLSRAFRRLEAYGLVVDGRTARVTDLTALRRFVDDEG